MKAKEIKVIRTVNVTEFETKVNGLLTKGWTCLRVFVTPIEESWPVMTAIMELCLDQPKES